MSGVAEQGVYLRLGFCRRPSLEENCIVGGLELLCCDMSIREASHEVIPGRAAEVLIRDRGRSTPLVDTPTPP